MREPQSFCEVFQRTLTEHPDRVAIRDWEDKQQFTWRQVGERVERIAAGLHALGVRHGDAVALMMTNRPEFHLVDLAACHLGAVPFSIYNTSSSEQVAFLFGNAGNRVVVCEEQFRETIVRATEDLEIEHILDVEDLADLEAKGDPGFDFTASWQAVGPEDLITLIYTSGTTGPPKGVELTHANVLFSISSAFEMRELREAALGGRVLSYLPDAHLANRWLAHYVPTAGASEIVTLGDLTKLQVALEATQPTAFLGVPMVWYRFKAGIEQSVAAEPGVRGSLLRWAMCVAAGEAPGRRIPMVGAAQHKVADKLVLSKLRARIGLGEVRYAATGAAPIAVEALHFFQMLGVTIAEGWGMSESCLAGITNRMDAIKFGTVGKPFPGVEISVAADGELLLRSPGVMRGYRNAPTQTSEAVDGDGWLHTGDIATIDDEGYVSIVDRKKELIINAAGKNMSPSIIEGAVRVESGLIANLMVVGDDRPYVVALITVDPVATAEMDRAAVHAEVAGAVERANAKLSRVEQIKTFAVLDDSWAPGGDEVTPTMKLRRRPINERYADQIEELYAS